LAVALALMAGGALGQTDQAETQNPPPSNGCPPLQEDQAIVGGKDIQPTQQELSQSGCPDVSPNESKETDELYNELMKQSSPTDDPLDPPAQ
jgi:hypothetical protein